MTLRALLALALLIIIITAAVTLAFGWLGLQLSGCFPC